MQRTQLNEFYQHFKNDGSDERLAKDKVKVVDVFCTEC